MKIKATTFEDIVSLGKVVDETGLFPSEMPQGFFAETNGQGEHEGIWLTATIDDQPIGFCMATPEKLADGTWNMLAIAVSPVCQRSGAGRLLVDTLERELKAKNVRILIADTSGTEGFQGTRAFYRKAAYEEVARIPDFWGQGDDKVTFWKSLR